MSVPKRPELLDLDDPATRDYLRWLNYRMARDEAAMKGLPEPVDPFASAGPADQSHTHRRPKEPAKLRPLAYAVLAVLQKSPAKMTRVQLQDEGEVTKIARDAKTIRSAVNALLDRKYIADDNGLEITSAGCAYLRTTAPAQSP
jgi:hypothetical protein